MRLSNNFTLEEFLVSRTAELKNIDMTPSGEIISNLQRLVDTCLQPLRDEVNATIYVSSGFRPLALNLAIGGSQTSEHVNGNAGDLKVAGQTSYDTCKLIVLMELPFDQVILEFPPNGWTHLGVRDILRSQQLTAYRKNGRRKYVPGILTMEELR